LLLSYDEYLALEAGAASADPAALTQAVKAANSSEGPNARSAT